MVRSYTNLLKEDDSNIQSQQLSIPILKATIVGFAIPLKNTISSAELELLIRSTPFITWIQALRFLTDYLLDDTYYITKFDDHNLARTKNQINLYQLLVKNKGIIEDTFNSVA